MEPTFGSPIWANDSVQPEHDAARQLWGNIWRIPTDEEWTALRNTTYYTWTWTNYYLNGTVSTGVAGWIVTRKNVGGNDPCANNHIFLPAAGYWLETNLLHVGSGGHFWSSSLYTEDIGAWYVNFYSDSVNWGGGGRSHGRSVRPVSE